MDFQVYTGACEGTEKRVGLGYRVVMDLMMPYQGKGHCLFIDNFYTSLRRLLDLLCLGTFCAGTVRTNSTIHYSMAPESDEGEDIEDPFAEFELED